MMELDPVEGRQRIMTQLDQVEGGERETNLEITTELDAIEGRERVTNLEIMTKQDPVEGRQRVTNLEGRQREANLEMMELEPVEGRRRGTNLKIRRNKFLFSRPESFIDSASLLWAPLNKNRIQGSWSCQEQHLTWQSLSFYKDRCHEHRTCHIRATVLIALAFYPLGFDSRSSRSCPAKFRWVFVRGHSRKKCCKPSPTSNPCPAQNLQ